MSELALRWQQVMAAMARTSDPLGDPLGLDFEPCTGHWHTEQWRRFAEVAPPGTPLVVYLHQPYCAKRCAYCLLAAESSAGARVLARYAEAVLRELERYGEILARVPMRRLHVGGGTPTLLDTEALGRVLGAARRAFSAAPGFSATIEAHPNTTTPAKLELMLAHGIDRVSFGVESLNPEALALANRSEQSFARVERAVRAAHALGLRVNVDLLAGLPGETLASFEDSLRATLALPIDALSVNRFLAEGSPLAATGFVPSAEQVRLASAMLERADVIVRAERPPALPASTSTDLRYGVQYSWGGAAPGYSQQDMIDPGSVLAIGAGGMGKLAAGYHYVARPAAADWAEAVLAGELPEQMVCRTERRFELAFHAADLLCRGELRDPALGRAFAPELEHLERVGVLARGRLAPGGRLGAAHLIAFLSGRTGSPRSEPEPGEYRLIGGELPPSLLWCRLALRAAAARR